MKNGEDDGIFRMLVLHHGAVILGAWIGILMAVGTLGLLLWAEHYAIATTSGLEEGAGHVVEAESKVVDPSNEGKLIHTSGEATTNERLTDPDFGIGATALELSRRVEMFQWKENKKETKEKDKTKTAYTYVKEWSSVATKSSFEEPKGHENPKDFPFENLDLRAEEARLGAFSLTTAQIKKMKGSKTLPVTQELLAQRPAEFKQRGEPVEEGKMFVSMSPGSTYQDPAVGDIRIHYNFTPPQVFTVVAKQSGQSFAPFRSSAGTDVDIIEPGELDTKAMFESAHGNTRVLYWAIRVVLMMLLAPAIFLWIRPMARVSDFELMDLWTNILFCIFGTFTAVFAVLLVVGVRWLIYQPVFGIEMIAIGVAGLAIARFVLRCYDKSGRFTPRPTYTKRELELLHRIALEPDNNDLRFELAELLRKRKNPQGEYIQLAVDIANLPEGDARRVQFENRAATLLKEHGRIWVLGLTKLDLWPKEDGGKVAPEVWMIRGVIQKCIVYKVKVLPDKAKQLFAAAPALREMSIHGQYMQEIRGQWQMVEIDFDFPGIFALPQLEQIADLWISTPRMQLKDIEAIASSPHLKNLKGLGLYLDPLGPAVGEILAKAKSLSGLNGLVLNECELGDAGFAALAKSPSFPQLQRLTIGQNNITHNGISALASSKTLVSLTQLSLESNKIGPEGAKSIAAADSLAKLTSINLSGADLGSDGFRSFAESTQLGQLTELKLNSNQIDVEGMRGLSSESFPKLQTLDLSNNSLGDQGLEVLVAWPGLTHVKKLVLVENSITVAGIRTLIASPLVHSLEELDLSGNEVTVTGARLLVAAESLNKLKILRADYAGVDDEGQQLLDVRFGNQNEAPKKELGIEGFWEKIPKG